MSPEDKIDYMILALQIAKEEIQYAKDFKEKGNERYNQRFPNGTLIRENLKSVGRLAGIVASDVVLSCYSRGQIFREEGVTDGEVSK